MRKNPILKLIVIIIETIIFDNIKAALEKYLTTDDATILIVKLVRVA